MMQFNSSMIGRRRLVGGLVLGATALGSAGLVTTAAHGTTTQATAPPSISTQGKTVRLSLVGGWNKVNAGFNFDGAAHGQVVATVPLGDTIVATFKNNAQGAMHSVRLT